MSLEKTVESLSQEISCFQLSKEALSKDLSQRDLTIIEKTSLCQILEDKIVAIEVLFTYNIRAQVTHKATPCRKL
jgi:hypothetical protein